MKHTLTSPLLRRIAGWLTGAVWLLSALQASAQEDPPGRVARLNFQQGTVSFSPAGDDSWYDVVPNRPITTGDRIWTDRGARAEVSVGSAALRMDDQTSVTFSELDDDTARITAEQGTVQLRVREDMSGQRFEIGTGNLAVVVDAPGDYRVDADPASDTTRVSVASGAVTLHGDGGESIQLGARQQLVVSGRNLAAVAGQPVRADGGFDRWVAERNRLEDQSIAARFVSRDVVGYQQLDNYGDWQSEADYGNVWYPRNVDADWAPYRDGQWVNVAPWGWTWVDAAPWGFAPSHYGRWARIGPRWGWVPGPANQRQVYAPAVVGFVGGAGAGAALSIGGGRNGVGWFPLAPGEAWRPGYRASQRYIDNVNRSAAHNRQSPQRERFANQGLPGAITMVPVDVFGRGPIGRRDIVRLPDDRMARAPVGGGVAIPLRNERGFGGMGRPVGTPPVMFQGAQPQHQGFQGRQREPFAQPQPQQGGPGFEPQRQQREALRQQQQQQQLQMQQQAVQAQQMQQAQQLQQMQQAQQRDGFRQQREVQQRAGQQQMQIQQQQQQQQQQALRQQQELQQRSAAQAQQAQQMQMMQQQQMQAQRAQQQQQQQQQNQQAQQQQNALRQAQEMQQRAIQQQQMQRQQQIRGSNPSGQLRDQPALADRP